MIYLSIIVPIYNTEEERLRHCLDSLACMSAEWCEVLLIDDGSKEYIGSICKEYTEQYSLMKYFYLPNGGVSKARNFGLKNAQGEYITFVDSDDVLLAENVNKDWLCEQLDFVLCDFLVENNGQRSSKTWQQLGLKEGRNTPRDLLCAAMASFTLCGPYAKFYRREFLTEHNIRFDAELISGEDRNFLLDVILCDPKLRYTNTCTYIFIHDISTGEKRFQKNPEKVIGGSIFLHQKMKNCMHNMECGHNNAASEIEKKHFKTLFAWIMALQSVKNGKSKCMEMIYEEAKNIDYGAWKMSRSEKIKQLILLKRMNLSIAFLAKIRQLHLHVNKEKVSLRIE